MRHLLLAPFTMHRRVIEMIRREAAHARAGRPARIVAKMNALLEEGVIRALYAASQAGVEIDLIVRGACALRPGVRGLSERIRVRSILGRFLEHHRVWYFENDGHARRVAGVGRLDGTQPVPADRGRVSGARSELRKRVVDEGLSAYLADTRDAWSLSPTARGARSRRAAASECDLRSASCSRRCASPTTRD